MAQNRACRPTDLRRQVFEKSHTHFIARHLHLSFQLSKRYADSQRMKYLADFTDHPYQYTLAGRCGRHSFHVDGVAEAAHTGLELTQTFRQVDGALEEQLTLRNTGLEIIELDRIELGFVASLDRPGWRLCAVPFRVQLDGSVHDYPVAALANGEFKNAVYSESTRPEPVLQEAGCLRSEAWAWGTGARGLLILKYNNDAIEYSVACPHAGKLRFGGAGLCLYGEPTSAQRLAPGESIVFGVTRYVPYSGGLTQAFYEYRRFLESKGHNFPADYNPPINWNELYDVGWHHSQPGELAKHYTRAALLREAAKARAVGCELLYLDPGWEITEGFTQWDVARLGSVTDLVKTLRVEFGLQLGLRTILRSYGVHWPTDYMVQHAPGQSPAPAPWFGMQYWELCLSHRQFWEEKVARIVAIAQQGVQFLMVDEMDWRGPCFNPTHGHPVPSTPLDHIRAVVELCREVRRQCPELIIEMHDPVWPWTQCRYLPTYFQQGFRPHGGFDENWGFEYMWDCLTDLKTGKALALYYYNLGCSIPLYLHITMAADNDQAVFFWWTASTVRHLGIGGKTSHSTIDPAGLPPHNPEKRFALYQEQMRLYRQLKPFFVRGIFTGIAENIHLHTLPGQTGGVINLFNLTDHEQKFEFTVPRALLGADHSNLPVTGAHADWRRDSVRFQQTLPALSPAVIRIGITEI